MQFTSINLSSVIYFTTLSVSQSTNHQQ